MPAEKNERPDDRINFISTICAIGNSTATHENRLLPSERTKHPILHFRTKMGYKITYTI